MFNMIPVANNYISLISSNLLKSMNRIEWIVLQDWCKFPERPEQIPQIQNMARKHKAKDRIRHLRKCSKSIKHMGTSVRGAVPVNAWGAAAAGASEASGWADSGKRDKTDPFYHVSIEGMRLTWNPMPRTSQVSLGKQDDYIKGDIKNDRDLGNLSPKKAYEKLSIVDLRKQMTRRGGMKPNTIKASTE